MQLTINNLSKTYANGVQALKDIELQIPTGMFGLNGPNGAGKSTLMRTIATLQEPDSGEIHLNGINVVHDKQEVRKLLGYLPKEFGVYPKVSAENLLYHFATLKGIKNKSDRKEIVASLLQRTNLWDVRKKHLGGFSGGMKQRFGIAQALLGNPKLIIVDEPTAGLDPSERNRFHNLLSEIGENIIVILSTHIIDDVQSLCSNMAIINHGKVIVKGKPQAILEEIKNRIWSKLVPKSQVDEFSPLDVINKTLSGGKVLIKVFAESQPAEGFEAVEATLEDIYFSTIKHSEIQRVAKAN